MIDWTKRTTKAQRDAEAAPDFIDSKNLNAALVEPGSVVRALGLVLFDTINRQNLVTLDAVNELRVKAALQPYTVAQFKAALAAKQGQVFYTMAEFLDALQAQMR